MPTAMEQYNSTLALRGRSEYRPRESFPVRRGSRAFLRRSARRVPGRGTYFDASVASRADGVSQVFQGGTRPIEGPSGRQDDAPRPAWILSEAAGWSASIPRCLLASSHRGELRAEAVEPAALLAGPRKILGRGYRGAAVAAGRQGSVGDGVGRPGHQRPRRRVWPWPTPARVRRRGGWPGSSSRSRPCAGTPSLEGQDDAPGGDCWPDATVPTGAGSARWRGGFPTPCSCRFRPGDLVSPPNFPPVFAGCLGAGDSVSASVLPGERWARCHGWAARFEDDSLSTDFDLGIRINRQS